jgi:ectoine hydroxylase-related dioxygenase (phytanoyl-CoA dioxygenase family)
MGTITMVDGSHRWKEIGTDDSMTNHFAERDQADLERVLTDNAAFNNADVVKIPMIIPKGHMSFHHCRIYHGSPSNRSDRPRRAVSFHLQDGDNRYREFTLSTGDALAYNHDVVVRKGPDGRPDYSDPDICPVLWRRPA